MTKQEIINKLKEYQHKSAENQIKNEKELIQLVKDLWDTRPTENEFDEGMRGICLCASMLHYIITHPIGGNKQ